MKKVFWVILAVGILAVLLVMWMIISMLSNMSFGISIGFGSLGIWLAIAMVAVWIYLKRKKSGFAGIAGWAAIAILLFVWFGPSRTSQIAQGTGAVLDSAADSVTSLVTTGKIKTPAQIAAARKAEADELKHQQELARIAAEGEAEARVAAQAAEARTLDEMRIPATFGPCLRINTDKLNCTTVTFGPGPDTFYDRQAPARHCILPDVKPARNSDDPTVFREINLGGGQKRYLGPSGLTVQFFDLKEGESYKGGKPCVIPK